MRVFKTNVRKFQEGGPMGGDPSMEQGAPMERQDMGGQQPQGGDPQQQIMQLAQQIIEQIGPEGAQMLAEALMQMSQGAAQSQAPQGQPAFRRGGRLIGRIR